MHSQNTHMHHEDKQTAQLMFWKPLPIANPCNAKQPALILSTGSLATEPAEMQVFILCQNHMQIDIRMSLAH